MAGRVLDQNALSRFSNLSSQVWLWIVIGVLTLTVLVVDILTPGTFTAAVYLYYFPIFVSSRLKFLYAPFVAAAVISVAAMAGYFLENQNHPSMEMTNRLFAIVTLWAMAILAYRRIGKNLLFIRARTALESTQRLRDMIVGSRLAIQILDRSGKRLFVNQALADLMGYGSPEEIMDAPGMALVAPHDREITRGNLINFVEYGEGVPPSFEFDGLRQDGSIIRLQVVMQEIEWEGTPAVQRTLIDISDRLEAQSALEESERRFRDLIESSPLGVQVNNASGRRLLVNRALSDMLGYDFPAQLAAMKPLTDIAPYEHGRIFSFQRITAPNNNLPDHYELDLLHKDGSIVPTMVYWRLLEWEGEPAVQRTFINISERKNAEADLAESERRYRELSQDLRLGLLVVSRRGKLMVNNAYAALLGYDSAEEFMATVGRYGSLAPYDLHRAPTMENIDATPPGELPASYKIDQVKKDGSIIPVEIFSRVFEWKGERAVQNIVIDLSERQRAEAALAKSERQFRELFEDLQLGLMISTREGKSLVNKALVDLLGYESAEELMAIDRLGDLAPHDRHRALTLARIEAAEEKPPSPIEFDLLHKDGSIVPVFVYWRLFEWEGEKAVQRIFVDLSERKRAEAALMEREWEYRSLIERAPIGMQIASGSGRRLWVNGAFAQMLGYDSTEQMLDLPGYSLVAPYHHDKLYPFSEIAKPGAVLRESDEIDLVCKDGSIRMTQVFRRQLTWQGEQAIQLAYIDLTDRKRMEQALATSEAHFRDLFEKSNMGMHINDRHHNRLFVNDALVKMLGYDSAEEIMSLERLGIVAPGARHLTRSTDPTSSVDTELPETYELDLWRKDGTTLPVQVFWRTIIWEGEAAVHRTYIDISERKRHERNLRERDRTVQELRKALADASHLGAMGEIASVIAHELHQPLAAIANTASAAQRRLSAENEDKTAVLNEMLPLISSQAGRAGRVIGGIRNLFDGHRVERSRENINWVVAEACELAANEFPSDRIKIDQQFPDPSPIVEIDRVQIQQVIYNLLRNAVDALSESTNKDVTVAIVGSDNQMIEISVRDNGPGLPGHVRSKLFEPFFTTKKKGVGMGMGLYTCQRIVEAHDGTIWAESDEDGGTTVRFTLPLAEKNG